jgi:hypothetical protein
MTSLLIVIFKRLINKKILKFNVVRLKFLKLLQYILRKINTVWIIFYIVIEFKLDVLKNIVQIADTFYFF